MLEVVVSGLVTGWAIAVPVGAVAAFLVSLTARTSLRVGAAAALGVAGVDGAYATLAVVGGAALSALIAPVAGPLRVVSAVVLVGVALWTLRQALLPAGSRSDERPLTPARAFWLLAGITAVNPATVVYFAAIVLGNHGLVETPAQGAAFVVAAFVASASWQLTLALGGAALGRYVAGPRGHRITGVVSALVITGLAVWTLVG